VQPRDDDSEAGLPEKEPEPAPEQVRSRAARAEAAIHAIAAGADPGAEAQNVSNRFTDDLTSRMRGIFGRRKRTGAEPDSR
jgi:hypothetical protein